MTDLNRIVATVALVCERHLPREVARRGRPPTHAQALILQLIVVQYLHGLTSEAAFFRWLKRQPVLPWTILPSRSQYNRRVKQLPALTAILLPCIAQELDCHRERVRIIDSASVPVVSYGLSDKSQRFPRGEQTNYGYCRTQNKRYYGCKLHLVTSKVGIPLHYELGPANEHDIQRLLSLGEWCRSGTFLLGDKGYWSGWRREYLKAGFGVTMLHPHRQGTQPNPVWAKRLLRKRRGNIETTFSQLKEQMGLERLRAKSYVGLEGRVAACLLAYVIGVRLNVRYRRPYRAIKSILL